jgi:hypothetical protein
MAGYVHTPQDCEAKAREMDNPLPWPRKGNREFSD